MHELRFSCDDLTLFHTADRQTNAARSATFIFSKNVAPRQLSNIHTSPSPSKHISTVLKATASPSLNSTHPDTHNLRIRISRLFRLLEVYYYSMPVLPPHAGALARRALLTAGPARAQTHMHSLSRRGLGVNHTQGVTLGVIGAYIVVIAILWNVPYVRWVLWPFKVHPLLHPYLECLSSRD